MPAPPIPHRKEFFNITDRLYGEFRATSPIIRVIADRLALMEEDFFLPLNP